MQRCGSGNVLVAPVQTLVGKGTLLPLGKVVVVVVKVEWIIVNVLFPHRWLCLIEDGCQWFHEITQVVAHETNAETTGVDVSRRNVELELNL